MLTNLAKNLHRRYLTGSQELLLELKFSPYFNRALIHFVSMFLFCTPWNQRFSDIFRGNKITSVRNRLSPMRVGQFIGRLMERHVKYIFAYWGSIYPIKNIFNINLGLFLVGYINNIGQFSQSLSNFRTSNMNLLKNSVWKKKGM